LLKRTVFLFDFCIRGVLYDCCRSFSEPNPGSDGSGRLLMSNPPGGSGSGTRERSEKECRLEMRLKGKKGGIQDMNAEQRWHREEMQYYKRMKECLKVHLLYGNQVAAPNM
jgi:hypothetical protein